MGDWWNHLPGLQQFFYGTGILFSSLLVVQTLMMLFGMHHEMPHDASGGGDSGADATGIHVLSVRTIIAFFVGFGWGGAAASSGGAGPVGSILLATLSGTLFMLGVFWLMKCLFALRYSGTLNYDMAVGQIGSVYMAIPPEETGNGQIEVLIQGRLQVLPACTKAKAAIPSRTKVRVVGTADPQTLLVETTAENGGEVK